MNALIVYSRPTERIANSLHIHKTFEIIHYLEGEGVLHTSVGDLPFSPGSIALVPAGISHGTSSKAGFGLICIQAAFDHIFNFTKPMMIQDNGDREAEKLIWMIYRNRTNPGDYLSHLYETYAHFVLQNIEPENELTRCLRKVAKEISDDFYHPALSPAALLRESGYSEDYLRAHFKKLFGKTPGDYLAELRIEHAKYLIHVYRDAVPLHEIAERCGFESYTYFSQKFKALTGQSPRAYKNKGL